VGGSSGGAGAGGVGAGGAGAGVVGPGGLGGVSGAAGSRILPILIAGGLTGVIAMAALVALSVVPVHSGGSGASPRGLVLVACPGSGPVLAVIDPGQKLLLTGRSSDGSWLQVYLPGPALPYAWVPAGELQASGDTSGLPVAGCEVAAASPSARPTPTPTPVANTGPRLGAPVESSDTIFLPSPATGCTQPPGSVTISVTASDPEGVSSVSLFWKVPGSSYTRTPMSHGPGTTWSAQLYALTDIRTTGTVSYYVLAVDASASKLERRMPASDATFVVRKCDLPPTVTDLSFKGPSGYVIKVPMSGGAPCPPKQANSITIVAYATDPDDAITRMVFYYTPFTTGTSKVAHLTLQPTNVGGTFTGTLYNADFPTLPDAGPYAVPWYLVAIDAAGRTSPKLGPPQGPVLQERSC
jgi:hypothetical protein